MFERAHRGANHLQDMRFFPLAASLVTAGMMWNVSAQDTLNPDADLAGTGLRRVVQESDVGTQEPGAPVDVALWRSALTDADLDAREAAFGRFVRAAQRDVALHPLLAEWRQAGGELGWTARMIQRELDRTGLGPATPWSRPDITSTIEDMRRQAERLRAGLGAPQGGTASRQSTSVQVEQDSGGVTVTISEDVNGAIQTETYAGPDLDAVRSAMPEEHRKLISGSSMGLRVGTHPFIASDLFDQHLEPFGGLRPVHGIDDLMRDFLDPGGLHRLPFDQPFAPFGEPLGLRGPDLVDPTSPPASIEPRTDLLGVYLQADDAGVLRVSGVAPNTLAQRLGVVAGERIVTVHGEDIREIEDIARALQVWGGHGELEVITEDRTGRQRDLLYRVD